jgi:hypothetical protein
VDVMWVVRSKLEVNVAEQPRQRQMCLVSGGGCGEAREGEDAVSVDVGDDGEDESTGMEEREGACVGMLEMEGTDDD